MTHSKVTFNRSYRQSTHQVYHADSPSVHNVEWEDHGGHEANQLPNGPRLRLAPSDKSLHKLHLRSSLVESSNWRRIGIVWLMMSDSIEKPIVPEAHSSNGVISKPKKFSESDSFLPLLWNAADRSKSFLTSPIFSVVVGENNSKSFLLHSELLVQESDRLAKDVQGGFNEESRRRIILPEEDSELFGYFVEYLYRGGWLAEEAEKVERESDYIILARLYALGERLQAQSFQSVILRKFTSSWKSQRLPDQGVCDLLDIACTELPERINEDPLRAQIFWYAASRLTRLQEYDYFLRLLETHECLGKSLCVRAGDSSKNPPNGPSEPVPLRFKSESIYPA